MLFKFHDSWMGHGQSRYFQGHMGAEDYSHHSKYGLGFVLFHEPQAWGLLLDISKEAQICDLTFLVFYDLHGSQDRLSLCRLREYLVGVDITATGESTLKASLGEEAGPVCSSRQV